MDISGILPIVIVCCVGIALCLGYLIFLFVRNCASKFRKGARREESFEFDDNTLTISLKDKRGKK